MPSAAEAYANALTALWRAETAQDARTNVVSTLSSDVFTLRDIVRHLLNQSTSETAIAGILGILLSPLLRIEDVEEPRTLVGDMLCHVKCAQTLTRVLTVLLDFRDGMIYLYADFEARLTVHSRRFGRQEYSLSIYRTRVRLALVRIEAKGKCER